MKKLTLAFYALGVFSASFGPAARADTSPSYRENLNGGFFLLHNLFDDEAKLPLLLDLKTAPQEIQDFAKKISISAKDGEAALEKMHDADPRINWDKNPLPQIEQDVRTSIKGEKQHQLLFGTKGTDFVHAMLVSQAEASKYAANIAKVMAQKDKNAWHSREFTRISDRWHALYEEDFRLQRNY
jgi:hypothetical protein